VTRLTVNGETRDVVTRRLDQLLERLGYSIESPGIAVAVNGRVVPRGEWNAHAVASGDEIEIVGAVQGG
jgi:sulfur carrier protein